MPRCDNEIRLSGSPSDNSAEQCRRHADTVCFLCGNNLCWRCAESCWTCAFNFCGESHLEEHAKISGHQVEMPEATTCTVRGPANEQVSMIAQFRGDAIESLMKIVEKAIPEKEAEDIPRSFCGEPAEHPHDNPTRCLDCETAMLDELNDRLMEK